MGAARSPAGQETLEPGDGEETTLGFLLIWTVHFGGVSGPKLCGLGDDIRYLTLLPYLWVLVDEGGTRTLKWKCWYRSVSEICS